MKNVKLILGDNRNELQKNSGYNIALTSPTYDFFDEDGKILDMQKYHSYQRRFLFDLHRFAAKNCQLFYVHKPRLRKNGHWGMMYSDPITWLSRSPWNIHQTIIWVRPYLIPEIKDEIFSPADERIYWLYKGRPRKIKNGLEELTSVWPVAFSDDDKQHYNFPKEISDRILASMYEEGDVVIDPYMGGGTVGHSCLQIGAKFIGIEIDEGRYNVAKSRLEKVSASLSA